MIWFTHLTIDLYLLQVLLLDLLLVLPLLALLGLTNSWLQGVKLRDELAVHDNPAFGVALAGSVLSLFLVLGATMQGEAALTLWHEALLVLMYGSASLLLVRIGLWLQDWLILRQIDLRQQIRARNLAAALVEAASAISIGLLLMAALARTDSHSLDGLLALLMAFALSQLMLSLITLLYQKLSSIALQPALLAGNTAVAIQFSGRLLAAALVVNTASDLVGIGEDPLQDLLLWSLATLAVMLVQAGMSAVIRTLLMSGINRADEIGRQANIAVASLDMAISIGISLLLNAVIH